jgi:hypothetical protein
MKARKKRDPIWPQDVLLDIGHEIAKGVNCAEILRGLLNDEKYAGREAEIPDLRTIQRMAQPYRKKNPKPDPMDEPFQWDKLAEYGIPWEASEYLLSLWHGIWKGELVESVEEAERITARTVLWAWRVHLAAPDISQAHTLMWATRFAGNEIGHIVFGMELGFEAFYQSLAFRNFEGEDQAEAYDKAVDEGRVKPVTVFAGWLPPREKS